MENFTRWVLPPPHVSPCPLIGPGLFLNSAKIPCPGNQPHRFRVTWFSCPTGHDIFMPRRCTVFGLNDSKCLCPLSNKFCKEILNLPEEHTALLVVFVWYFCHTAGEGRSIHTKRADSPEDKRCLEHLTTK